MLSVYQLLHKGGPFINSLLHLEELGFRSSSPTIKKIAFIAWKSLIDNFALNPGVVFVTPCCCDVCDDFVQIGFFFFLLLPMKTFCAAANG